MLKLKLQYFDYLMWRANSLEETLMLGKTENKRRRMKWLDGIANTMDMNLSKLQETGEQGMPQSMELQRPEHYLVTEQQ